MMNVRVPAYSHIDTPAAYLRVSGGLPGKLMIFLFAVVTLLTASCAGNRSNKDLQSSYQIGIKANLNAYKYAYVIPIWYQDRTRDVYGLEAKAADWLRAKGIRVIDLNALTSQSQDEKYKTLQITIQHHQEGDTFKLKVDAIDVREATVYSGSAKVRGDKADSQMLHSLLLHALQGFGQNYTGHYASLALNPEIEIRKRYRNWEEIDHDEQSLRAYLNTRTTAPLEGIWSTVEDDRYKLGIIKDSKSSRDFIGFVIDTRDPRWLPGFLKMEFFNTAYDNIFKVNYYMGDHTLQHSNLLLEYNGLFELELKDVDGSKLRTRYIKMYPEVQIPETPAMEEPVTSAEGSGFLVNRSGLVATNWHVIEDYKSITVSFPSLGRSYEAYLETKDDDNDLALIRMRGFKYGSVFDKDIPYRIPSARNAKQGQKVTTIGYPLGGILGESSKVSDGIVNSLSGIEGDTRLFQISNPIQPGNSGGPLFDSCGNICGIVVASINATYLYERASILPQNVNFAVKSDYLRNLLNKTTDDIPIMNSTLSQTMTVERLTELCSPYVVKITVEY